MASNSKSIASSALFLATVLLILASAHAGRGSRPRPDGPDPCLAPEPEIEPPKEGPKVPRPSEPVVEPPEEGPGVPQPRPPRPSDGDHCPMDVDFSVCAKLITGRQPMDKKKVKEECCPCMDGLSGNEAAKCMCSAVSAYAGGGIAIDSIVNVALGVCAKLSKPTTCRR